MNIIKHNTLLSHGVKLSQMHNKYVPILRHI